MNDEHTWTPLVGNSPNGMVVGVIGLSNGRLEVTTYAHIYIYNRDMKVKEGVG